MKAETTPNFCQGKGKAAKDGADEDEDQEAEGDENRPPANQVPVVPE
jgi:hypothetical protein